MNLIVGCTYHMSSGHRLQDVRVILGIQSPKLRMVLWNLNTLRFGGDYTPQSSSDKESQDSYSLMVEISSPENERISPEKSWLEDELSLWKGPLSGNILTSLRGMFEENISSLKLTARP